MTPVARLLALWLAAFWLPLTLHCPLTAWLDCGGSATCCEDPCGCTGTSDCHSAGCKIIESGKYFLTKATLAVHAASSLANGSFEPAACPRLMPAVAMLTPATGAPPGWQRSWQFVLRAAPAPRAPATRCG